ncbi:hypothetical protein [Actinopolymorpha pittospori]|uniref:Secreted protein n=1 Tax=Actinopolymorpha pittospori TaxID=648752 RepID=A0A927MQU7_9ACTN|nr:hypothetical protein [Actinopolymorpha pittospori]MBE1604409.1 hypothetical protein [Actinopolymorpha pittospori]
MPARAPRRMAGVALAVLALVLSSVSASAPASAAPVGAPVILFPAFHLTKLSVTVHNQTTAPECPRSGRFEDWYRNSHPSRTFNQVCQDKLLTLRYDRDPAKPMPSRFSDQPGVDAVSRTTDGPAALPSTSRCMTGWSRRGTCGTRASASRPGTTGGSPLQVSSH